MREKAFLENLLKIGALKFGSFTLASGVESKFYLDLRLIPSYPELFKKIGNLLVNRLKGYDYNIIVGIPTAGVPFATYIAVNQNKPLIYLRKESKSHGTKKTVEGISVQDKKVLLVDDLISSGHSKEFAITRIRKEKGIVNSILVIIDRRMRNEENLIWEKFYNVEILSLFSFSSETVLKFGKANNLY